MRLLDAIRRIRSGGSLEVPSQVVRREVLEELGYKEDAHRIPLGMSAKGVECWDVTGDQHLLVASSTGGGKAMAVRIVICHALEHPETWEIITCDPKRIEFGCFRGYVNMRVVEEPEEILAAVKELKREMVRRSKRLQEAGVKHFRKLSPQPRRLLLVIDSVEEVVVGAGREAEADSTSFAIHVALEDIARLGRETGVHLLLVTQRPTAEYIPTKITSNITARLAVGRISELDSRVLLGTDSATQPSLGIGRATMRTNTGGVREIQLAYVEVSDLPPKDGEEI